jgi:hypothetical protein
MELDPDLWQLFDDGERVVKDSAVRALAKSGVERNIFSTQIAHRRGSGAADASCVEVWCVDLVGSHAEVRVCRAVWDSDDDMDAKLAERFAALP